MGLGLGPRRCEVRVGVRVRAEEARKAQGVPNSLASPNPNPSPSPNPNPNPNSNPDPNPNQVRKAHGVPAELARFECGDALEWALPPWQQQMEP